MRTRTLAFTAAAMLALTAAACGSGDDSTAAAGGDATRTITVEMRDTAYSPDRVEVKAGETLRFVFTNKGTVVHDAYIGDEAAQEAHEAAMNSSGSGTDHDADHDMGASGVTVEPGKTAELTYTFAKGDELVIGCHEPGHYADGMRMAINVT